MKGHLRAQAPGSWQLIVFQGRDPATGKKRYKYETFRGGKRAAQTRLAELVAAAEVQHSSTAPLDLYLQTWLEHHRAGVRPGTALRYEWAVRTITAGLGGTLADLTPSRVQAWVHALSQTKAPRTVRLCAAVLRAALSDAERQRLIPRSPAVHLKLPRVEPRRVDIPEPEALRTFLDSLTGPIRLPAMLAYYAGLRRGEALGLTWQHVDLSARILRVEEQRVWNGKKQGTGPPKTRHGIRWVSLPAPLVEALTAERARQEREGLEGPVCCNYGGPWNLVTFAKTWERVEGSPGTFHTLRHAHEAHMIDAGVDPKTLAERMGHGSAVFSLDVYGGRVKPARHLAAAEAFERLVAEKDCDQIAQSPGKPRRP